jgi:hypothetical protein
MTEAAFLSICDGNKAVAQGEGVQSKNHVPDAQPG